MPMNRGDDPAEYSVQEVQAYLASDLDEAERQRVLDAEASGKERKSLQPQVEAVGKLVASNLDPEETEADVVALLARDAAIEERVAVLDDPEAAEMVREQFRRQDELAAAPLPSMA